MATLWGELGSKAWLGFCGGGGLGGGGWLPAPHADLPMYVSVTGGVGSMVWLGLAFRGQATVCI